MSREGAANYADLPAAMSGSARGCRHRQRKLGRLRDARYIGKGAFIGFKTPNTGG